MTSDDPRPTAVLGREHFELVARLTSVLAPILLAEGVGVRFVAFLSSNRVSAPLTIAAAQPVAVTVGAGLGYLALLLPFVAFDVLEPRIVHGRRGRFAVSVSVMYLIGAFVFIPAGWIAAPAIGAFVMVGVRPFRRHLDMTQRSAVALIGAVIGLGMGIIMAFSGVVSGVYAGNFTFDGTIPNGRYTQLGETGGVVYLYPCDGKDRRVTVVDTNAIKVRRFDPPSKSYLPPSLFTAIRDRVPLRGGVSLDCH